MFERKAQKQYADKNKGDANGTNENIFPGSFESQFVPMMINQRRSTKGGNLCKYPYYSNMVGQISTALAAAGLNIHNMVNKSRGEMAYTLVDVDSDVNPAVIDGIRQIAGVLMVRYIPQEAWLAAEEELGRLREGIDAIDAELYDVLSRL